ncbi:MAG: hypothetical protein Q7K55_04090 [Candidatus Levybacteria bacterium]|nr:hypothetical protein [Candidatus Levybacteria bacterium]
MDTPLQKSNDEQTSPNINFEEKKSKNSRVIMIGFVAISLLVPFILGGYFLGKTNNSPNNEFKTSLITAIPTPQEIIDIDSRANPELGLAGISSSTLVANGKEITLRLLAPDREKITISDFPCETKEVTAVKGAYRIIVLETPSSKEILAKLDLGTLEFVINPPEIEQTGLFSKKVILNENPEYEAFTLAFRKSCFDTQVSFYTFNDKTNSVARIPFVRKDGALSDFILIPKGLSIPQIDDKGNIISSSYNDKTKWRDKVRYTFNLEKFEFEELESYSQPK